MIGDVTFVPSGSQAGTLLDSLVLGELQANVTGMRAEHHQPTLLGRPIGCALLRGHGLDDLAGMRPCGERGEYHTLVTAYRGMRFLDEDPAGFAHAELDGIWALQWPSRYHR